MYLSNVRLVNFRNFQDFSIDFQPNLTLVLGENNIGKTNLVDAIRIVLNSNNSEGRDIWAKLSDIYHSDDGKTNEDYFEIHLTFAGLSPSEWTLFNSWRANSGDAEVAQIHFRYRKYLTTRGVERGRPEVWVGATEGTDIESEVMSEIKTTFLPALRNVEADLRPGKNNRISRLLSEIADQVERDEMVKKIREANIDIQGLPVIERTVAVVNRNLGGITGNVRPLAARFAIADPQFQEIANSIKVLVGRYHPAEIGENGLGYNNILYVSTVLSELNRSADNEVSLPILLVEEPEAHLHPQLQMRLINHLVNRKDAKVQVILTSHSPVLASKFPLDNIVVVHEGRSETNWGKILSRSIGKCHSDKTQAQDLQRYLDITKSTLFFSRGVILVEGISEALLLPVLARKIDVDLTLHDVTIVNVSSLAFEPFVKLFQESGLDIPCALLTDSDPKVTEDEKRNDPTGSDQIEYPEILGQMSATAQSLKALESSQVRVFLASKTFEYDLALASQSNAITMTEIYRDKLGHSDIGQRIGVGLRNSHTSREIAKAFFVPSIEKYPREKGVFAQKLAAYLESEEVDFVVPVYIQDAIHHAIGAYALYTNGISRLLSLIKSDHPSYALITSKQSDLEIIIAKIHKEGLGKSLREQLTSLLNEMDQFSQHETAQSFREFCGLK